MNKIFIRLPLLACFVLSTITAASYKNTEDGYTVQYPNKWKKQKVQETGEPNFIILTPPSQIASVQVIKGNWPTSDATNAAEFLVSWANQVRAGDNILRNNDVEAYNAVMKEILKRPNVDDAAYGVYDTVIQDGSTNPDKIVMICAVLIHGNAYYRITATIFTDNKPAQVSAETKAIMDIIKNFSIH